MTRVKRGVVAHRRRERVLAQTKGFKWRRKTNERTASEALVHAWAHAFRGRKQRKRDSRTLWNVKIGAAARENDTTYSKLIASLKKQKVTLNRKMLADLAENNPEIFKKIVAAK